MGKSGPLPVLSIKFYWNLAVPIYLYIVYDCFPPITAELGRCSKDSRAYKTENIYCLVSQKKFADPGLKFSLNQKRRLLLIRGEARNTPPDARELLSCKKRFPNNRKQDVKKYSIM